MWPRPGMRLRRNATSGRIVVSRIKRWLPSSAAPHSLQKLAPSTTTGNPHREQNRGLSYPASGTEGKRSVAYTYCVSILARSFVDPLSANESSILTAEVAQAEAAVGRFDRRMMPRDRGVAEHDVVVGR